MNYLAAVLMLACCAAAAQQAEEEVAAPAVQVSNLRNPILKSYRTMLKGADTYASLKAMAPASVLRFRLLPPQGGPSPAFTLRIANDETSVEVPVDAHGGFDLPRLPQLASDAELIVNARRGSARWTPDIHAPGEPDTQRRMGDLRLECAVWWEIEQGDIAFVKRKLMQALGGPCTSSAGRPYIDMPRRMASATLVQGSQRLPLKLVMDGYAFMVPLHDKAWSNEALVKLEYQE